MKREQGVVSVVIADQLAKNLITSISKKNKAATVKPAQIKNHMWIFVNALIENPTFDSQTKETLTLPAMSDEMQTVKVLGAMDSVIGEYWVTAGRACGPCQPWRPRRERHEGKSKRSPETNP